MEYKRLDLERLSKRKRTIVPMEDALKDIIPIKWSEEVRDGSKKITVKNLLFVREQMFV